MKGILKKDYLKYVELSSTLKPSDEGSENKNVGSSQQMPASRFNPIGYLEFRIITPTYPTPFGRTPLLENLPLVRIAKASR